jgi:2-polyprenyl-3-methyl-5-hydroxy-6-metoxy-1,4-benzoquinol methylase
MERIPEPELMDGLDQARAYAEADFADVNAGFVQSFAACFPDLPAALNILDLGCGPGDIPIRLARAYPEALIQAVDGAPAMIELAEQAMAGTAVAERVILVQSTIQEMPDPATPFHAVVSNSLLHHLHDPAVLWHALPRQGAPGTAVYVMDLRRPQSAAKAAALVEEYAGDEPEQLRTDFYQSLMAAFTPAEVEWQLAAAGLDDLSVRSVSDRHLLVSGRLPAE